MTITAFQDLGCRSRPKYVYQFSVPVEDSIVASFSGCDIRRFGFSRIVPHAKDLVKINKKNAFQADFILGGSSAIAYFEGFVENPSMRYLDDFARRLQDAGYGRVHYVKADRSHCNRCPAKLSKGCSPIRLQPTDAG